MTGFELTLLVLSGVCAVALISYVLNEVEGSARDKRILELQKEWAERNERNRKRNKNN